MNRTFSDEIEVGYCSGISDIQFDLETKPRRFNFEKLEQGMIERGYEPDLIEMLMAIYPGSPQSLRAKSKAPRT